MSVALACTWRPRGETNRLLRLRQQLAKVYDWIVVAMTSSDDLPSAEPIGAWENTALFVSTQRFWGRFEAVHMALDRPVSHVHYADLDMLVRWIEERPDEWRETVKRIQEVDCLITGRSEHAFQTRPRAIQQTEAIINLVGSFLLEQNVDLGLGSRGFSRRAGQVIVSNSKPGGFGDLEWPILVKRAGLAVHYVAVDGVDWESPDQYRDEAADEEIRREVAERYDQRPSSWALRVQMAHEIIDEGIAAM